MRILFISSSPIQREISIGNTFLNVFDGIDDVEFASICTKTGTPDPLISRCFCITEKMLINNLLGKGKAGKELELKNPEITTSTEKDSQTTTFVKRWRWSIFFWIQNTLWRLGRWKSHELKTFVEEYRPDIIFTVLSDKIFMNRLICHVISLANAKTVVYAWDNNYSMKKLSFSPFEWITHFCNRYHMRNTVAKADMLYVISDVQKQDYEKSFHKPCTVLTKSEDFSLEPSFKVEPSVPLKLVYTGNLYANRWKSLAMLVRVLKRLNLEHTKAELWIYSSSNITTSIKKALDVEGVSYFMGSISAQEVIRVQQDADVLVHAEAIDLKNRLTVRQSFSTKLVDYFMMSRPIVAVGPKDVASIKHLIDNDCAIVADNEQDLYEKLSLVIDDTQKLNEYAERAYMCGRLNHDKKQQQTMLHQDLLRLAKCRSEEIL